jgi:uncharacterized protein YdeI (BOF family)
MKKGICLAAVGMLVLSSALYAQSFGGGGYAGPSIEPISIADVRDADPNTYVVVTGIITQQNAPGYYVLTDAEAEEDADTIFVRIDSYAWANLEVDDATPVLIYGIVLKSASSVEILALRVGFPEEEE